MEMQETLKSGQKRSFAGLQRLNVRLHHGIAGLHRGKVSVICGKVRAFTDGKGVF